MYKPINLKAKDFQSFESLSYNFEVGKAILIEGENRTDEGQKTNGSGKSSFGEMIYYLLLGTSSTGKRDIKLVRRGCKEANLEITFKNDYLNQELTIKRTLYAKSKSSILEILINGVPQNDRYSSVTEGNKLILELLDISSDDLKNFYLVNRNRFVSFFDSPDSAKRNLLARFSSIEILNKLTDEIDSDIKERESNFRELEFEKTKFNSNAELLQSQIEEKEKQDLYNSTKQVLQSQIEQYKETIKTSTETIKTFQQRSIELNKGKSELEKQVEQLNQRVKDLQSIDFIEKLSENSKKQENFLKQIEDLKKEKVNLENEVGGLSCDLQPILVFLEGVITCPNCKTEFSLQDKGLSIDEAKKLVDEASKTLDELEAQKKELISKIAILEKSSELETLKETRNLILRQQADAEKELRTLKYQISSLTSQIYSTEKTVSYNESQVNTLKAKIVSLEKSIADTEKQIVDLKPDLQQKEIESLKKQKEEFLNKAKNIEGSLNKINDMNSSDAQWKERINQFYVYLTNKTLELIQSHCNHYLSAINSDLTLKFDGFKTLADGRIKESVNATISRDGTEEEDYKCFSGGEKGRMIFSTILTFQNFINEKSKSGGLDLLLIDEVLDQVDSEGMGLFVNSLSELEKTIFIVSQVKTEMVVENTLLIVKEKGISRIFAE